MIITMSFLQNIHVWGLNISSWRHKYADTLIIWGGVLSSLTNNN